MLGATAAFATLDKSTQGTWKGVYGADGYSIPQMGGTLPSYAAVTFNGASQWVWNYNTMDVAAVQKPNGTDRIASCWYNASGYSIDINLTDGKTHRVALYCLDWDSMGRQQTVTVTDAASGAVLNSQTVSAFNKGAWLVWDISGRVSISVRSQAGNAVAGGIFFGGNAGSPAPNPAPAQVAAPQIDPAGGTFTNSVSVRLTTSTAGATVRYTLDGATPTSTSATYSAPLTLTGTTTLKARAFSSGMTDSEVSTATFTRASSTPTPSTGATVALVKQDNTAQGNWRGMYGGDGMSIPNLGGAVPAYASMAFSGSSSWVWNYNTTDIAAVQKLTGAERIASCWYAASSFTADLNINDGQTHRVAMYFLDWDGMGRQQTVTVKDAGTGAVFSTHSLSSFQRGTWLVWDVTGRVKFTFAAQKGNAVLNGVFFGPAGVDANPVLQVATPAINPPGGSFSGPTTVTISTATSGATIRYTTDGSTPTSSSAVYSVALTPSTAVTIKAKAFKTGMTDSAVATAVFNISNPTPPASSLPDLAGLPNRVFPAPEGFDMVQYAADGKLGFIVWRDQQLIYRERNTSGGWTEEVVSNSANVFKMLTAFTYYGLREDYRFQPAAVLLYDSASRGHVFQASGRNVAHYMRGTGGWSLAETIAAPLVNDNINTLVGAVGPNDVFHLGTLSAGLTRNLTYGSNKNGAWSWSVVSTVSEAALSYWAPPYAPRWFSLAVDSRNVAHFAFRTAMTLTYDAASHPRAYSELKYANNASGQWSIALVQKPDDSSAEAANGASVAIAPDGRPRIVSWYNDRGEGGSSANSRLFYHEPNTSGAWGRTQILSSPDGYVAGDGPKGAGFSPYLRFDATGRPHVLFLDHAAEHFYNIGQQEYAGNLRHAWWNGSSWAVETIYRQTGPLDREIVYPAFAMRGNEMAVTLLQRDTKWNMSSYPPISNSTYYFRFFTKPLP